MTASSYRERAAGPGLRADVACTWVGLLATDAPPYTDRILPDGCIDIIWDGDRCFVAGPDTGPVPLRTRPGTTLAGIRFRPGHAPSVLGVPACALRDQRPDIAALWDDRAAAALTERLASASTAWTATTVLEDIVRTRARTTAPADALIDGLIAALGSGHNGPGVIARIAADLGVTERTLHRRCTAAVGYGPKLLDRVLRLRRAMALADLPAMAGSLGAVAAASGYADQAHFTHEVRRLTGLTPSDLYKTGG